MADRREGHGDATGVIALGHGPEALLIAGDDLIDADGGDIGEIAQRQDRRHKADLG